MNKKSEKYDGVDEINRRFHENPNLQYERNEKKRHTTLKTLGCVALVTGVAVAGSGAVFAKGVTDELALRTVTKGKVENGGTATIEKVSMDMPPITLATAETEVTGVKVAFENNVKGIINFSLGETTVTRDANVETLITLDPGLIDISYDNSKDKLTFSAPEAALTTSVDIPTGEAKTVDSSSSAINLPSGVLTAIANSIAGTFGADASEVPLLGGIADGTMKLNAGLEKFADLDIVTQVDKACTPLIPQKIENFNEQLKENIKTAVQGELLSPNSASKSVNEGLSALMKKPLSEVQAIVDDATVELPTDYSIGPDQGNITEFDNYIKSGFFSEKAGDNPPLKCGVSKDATLSVVDDGDKK